MTSASNDVRLVAALRRWWRDHGARWGLVRWLAHHVSLEDVEAEVLCVALERQRGASRWDPERSTIDAYAGVIGRSIVMDIAKARRETCSPSDVSLEALHVEPTPWRSGSVRHSGIASARGAAATDEARESLGLAARRRNHTVWRPRQMGLFA